jgi:bifunctional DNase/RNase
MPKVVLVYDDILLGSTPTTYQLILKESNGKKRLPIIIGASEAQSIVLAVEGKKVQRPNSHDLFLNFSKKLSVNVEEVFINNLEQGIFYSEIHFTGENISFKLDSRTSDAIALALRFNAPIHILSSILLDAGVDVEESEYSVGRTSSDVNPPRPKSFEEELELMSDDELENMLQFALNEEDYVKAAVIRDEISKRK